MKRIFFLLLAMGLMQTSMAQYGNTYRKLKLGFTFSPLISVLNPQEPGVTRHSAKAGFNFGLMADVKLNEAGNYMFASGFQILLSGSKLKYDAGKGLSNYNQHPAEYNMKLTWVEVPLALKLKTRSDGGMDWWGQFGTYLAFPVKATANIISLDQTYDKVNILPEVNRVNVGMILGAGMEYPIGDNLRGIVGITYQNGFVDVTRNARWNDGRVNINSFALKLGMYF